MKFIKAILTGLFLLSVFSTKGFAQQTTGKNDALKDAMYAIMDDSLANYSFDPAAKKEIVQMIESADSLNRTLKSNSDKSALIIKDFKILIAAIEKNKLTIVREEGSTPMELIAPPSITKAKRDVCPLFGFCK